MPNSCELPRFVRVKQHFPKRGIADLAGTVNREMASREIGRNLPKGALVAIGVGSRGVASIPELAAAAVGYFVSLGLRPFVIPAMGSHGGGTDEGQRKVLAHLGVTEESVGCPIVSSIETIDLGRTPEGTETYMDRAAFESAGVFLINRVKWHTSFEAPIESGVMKMAAIGLGKVRGATNYHRAAVRAGLGSIVQSVGRHVLASGKVIGGLGVVEDANHEIGRVCAMPANEIESTERELLELARSWMARLPFDADLLIVDEIGKQFSGTGMDSKIVNRHPYGSVNPWPWAPKILKIFARRLSPKSYGNAIGIGMADMISRRLSDAIDWPTTLVNAQAASNTTVMQCPYSAANDREGIQLLSEMVGRDCPADVTAIWIRNTLDLGEIAVTDNLVRSMPTGSDVLGEPFPLQFDEAGELQTW